MEIRTFEVVLAVGAGKRGEEKEAAPGVRAGVERLVGVEEEEDGAWMMME